MYNTPITENLCQSPNANCTVTLDIVEY